MGGVGSGGIVVLWDTHTDCVRVIEMQNVSKKVNEINGGVKSAGENGLWLMAQRLT